MPYVITTKRLHAITADPGCDDYLVISRRAVATPEEAQDGAARIVMDAVNVARDGKGNLFPALSYSPHVFDAQEMTELGGTVGPLPDGTVIKVAPTTYHALWLDTPAEQRSGPYFETDGDQNIAAYNAAQEVT
jgi:hypothetical protein